MATRKITDLMNVTSVKDTDLFIIETSEGTRSVSKKNLIPYVTPQMFGAIGDGKTDDTEAIQNAINSGNNVYIPQGVYIVKNTLSISTSQQVIKGEGFNSVIAYTGEQTDNYLIDISGENNTRHHLCDFVLNCCNLCNGLCVSTGNRQLFDNIKVYRPYKVGVGVLSGGSTYNNIEVHGMNDEAQYDGYIPYAEKGYDKIGILVEKYDNFFTNTRTYCLDIGLLVLGHSNHFKTHKSFVCQYGCVFGSPNYEGIPFDTIFEGESQECYGQPFDFYQVRNGYFKILSDGNGVFNSDTMPVLSSESTEGYDENGNPIACLRMNGCYGVKVDMMYHARMTFTGRNACERYVLMIDDLLKESNRNTIGCEISLNDMYRTDDIVDNYPILFNGSHGLLLTNIIKHNGDNLEKLLAYDFVKLTKGIDSLRTNVLAITKQNDGMKVSVTDTTYPLNIKCDLTDYYGKDIAFKFNMKNNYLTDGLKTLVLLYFTFSDEEKITVIYNNQQENFFDYGRRIDKTYSGVFKSSQYLSNSNISSKLAEGATVAKLELYYNVDFSNITIDVPFDITFTDWELLISNSN